MSPDINFSPMDVHRDERGWVSEIYSGIDSLAIRNIHVGTMNPNCVRGNHVHSRTREWIAFGNTPVQVKWGDPGDVGVVTKTEPFRVYLPPGLPHAFKNTGNQPVTFAAFTDRKYDPDDPDTESVKLFSS